MTLIPPDKMGWGQTTRTVLVWPPGSRLLQRRLDLVLLQRHSRSMGSQLALITDNWEIRFHARSLAIPVFETIQQAQTSRWRNPRRIFSPRPARDQPGEAEGSDTTPRSRSDLVDLREAARPAEPAWRQNPWVRLGVFATGAFAILAIASFFVPTAEIRIQPMVQTQETQFIAQSSSAVESITQSGMLPANEISVIVEGRDRIPSSGRVQLQNTAATGSVLFTNLTDDEVVVPEGTVVQTLSPDPVRFATTEAVEVPASPGEPVLVPVIAQRRGAAGNVPVGGLAAIEGPLGLSLSATNPSPTQGGSNVDAPAPSRADRLELYNRLLDSLKASAAEEIGATLETGDLLISPQPELVQIIQETYTPAADEAAEFLDLHLQVEFRGLSVPAEAIQILARSILDAGIPPGFMPAEPIPQVEHLSQPVVRPDGTTSWEVLASREIVAQIDDGRVVEISRGHKPLDVQRLLQDRFEIEAPPAISLNPSWWPRLPYLPFRIQIELSGSEDEIGDLPGAHPGS